MNKKLMIKLITILFFLLLIILFVVCSNNFTATETIFSHFSSRKEELLKIAMTGTYSIDQTNIEKDLSIFVANQDFSRSSSITSSNEINVTILDSYDYRVSSASYNRSASLPDTDDISFYLMNVENKTDGTEGYALTCNDRRIGEILLLTDKKELDSNIIKDPFMQIYLANLEVYIENTVMIWNTITDSDIAAYTQRPLNIRNTPSSLYTYNNWVLRDEKRCNMVTRWAQDGVYADAIQYYYGDFKDISEGNFYIAGCGAVALAQILAYKQYPETCSAVIYRKLENSGWNNLYSSEENVWNGNYDWNKINSTDSAADLGPEYQLQIGALLFDIAEGIDSLYLYNDVTRIPITGSYSSDRLSYLNKTGYQYDPETYYDYSNVKESIDNDCPVMIRGYSTVKTSTYSFLWWTWTFNLFEDGHCWVIDGYADGSCTAVNKIDGSATTLNMNFIHCNPGWAGNSRYGYYVSGVFDMGKPALFNKSAGIAFFNYNMKITTNIEPISK